MRIFLYGMFLSPLSLSRWSLNLRCLQLIERLKGGEGIRMDTRPKSRRAAAMNAQVYTLPSNAASAQILVEVQARTGQVSAIDIFNAGSRLTLDVPLYEGGLLRAQVQTARAAVATARWELEAEQERVETEARAQWELIESLALAVQDFGQAVEEARTAATLIRDKLAAGRAAVVDEVDARHAVLRTEHDVLDARLRLAGARIDLLRLLAALDPDG